MSDPTLDAFDALTDRLVAATFEKRPSFATWAGEHRHDAALEDVSASGLARERARLETARHDLSRVPEEALDLDRQVDRAILLDVLDRDRLELGELGEWEQNPLTYEYLAGSAIHALLARDFAPLEERLRSAAARVRLLPGFFAEARRNLARVPRVHAETAVEQHQGLVSLVAEELRGAARGTKLEGEVGAAVEAALPELAAYGRWLKEELLPKASGDFRLGRDCFARKLRLALQSELSIVELERQAQEAFEEVRERIDELSAKVLEAHAPGEAKLQGRERVRRALDVIASEHPTREGLLEACRGNLARIQAFLEERKLVELPAEPLAVEWTPPFLRGVSTAMLDSPGPLDRGQRSFYYVSPIPDAWSDAQAESFLREYNGWQLWLLSIHEALPGHYVQLAHANRCPSKVRGIWYNGPFVEGWAVYTEKMMVDEGFLDGDVRLALAREKFFLRAVTNALLDVRIHAGDLDEAGALRLMTEGAYQEEREARGKWRRACLTSTQLSTYFVGFQEVWALREECRTAWGERFSLRRFHDRAVAHGSPPVRHLSRLLMSL